MSCKTYVTAVSDKAVPAATTHKDEPVNGNDCPMIDIEQQTIDSPEMVERRKFVDITFSPWFQKVGLDFPLFTDEFMTQYQQHNVKHFNPFVFIPTVLLFYIIAAVREGLAGFHISSDGDVLGVRITATFSLFMAISTSGLYFTYHALRLKRRNKLLANLQKKFGWCPFQVEEILLLCCQSTVSFFLISRVLAGQCPPNTTLILQQTCNQLASSGGIPSDMVYTIYWCPLLATLCLKNIGIRTLIFTNVAGFVSVAFCIVYGNLWNDYFSLLMWIFFSNASFEIERLQRVGYAQTVKILDSKEVEMEHLKQEFTLQEALTTQMLKLNRAEDEKRLKETEAMQLRSLMGNVAHDLKTPLFTIEADVETLKMIVEAIPEDIIDTVVESLREVQVEDGHEDDLDPDTIFDSLWATIRFMVAAINRGQDYCKSSNNIALIPANGTFELKKILSQASRCLRSILPMGRKLIIHPLPKDMCAMIISDSHWLSENILCLVSNAIKYSDSGDVDLYIRISNDVRVRSGKDSTDAAIPHTTSSSSLSSFNLFVESDQMLVVTIEDHGVGVSEEMRETLFQPFRQAQRMAGGTGLGLFSLSKRIIALGGVCGVKGRSDNSQGSAFWFSFPYRPDETNVGNLSRGSTRFNSPRLISPQGSRRPSVQPSQSRRISTNPNLIDQTTSDNVDNNLAKHSRLSAQQPQQSLNFKTTNFQGKEFRLSHKDIPMIKILLTDDTQSILKVVGRMLKINGHLIETASNGHQSLEKLKSSYVDNDIDMLLTDLQMPVMDGIECTKRFRVWEEEQQCLLDAQGLPRRPRFLIIGMSANSDTQSKQEALDAGMDSFCPKPFNYHDFETIIRTRCTKASIVEDV